jgi:hypothetical protein
VVVGSSSSGSWLPKSKAQPTYAWFFTTGGLYFLESIFTAKWLPISRRNSFQILLGRRSGVVLQ